MQHETTKTRRHFFMILVLDYLRRTSLAFDGSIKGYDLAAACQLHHLQTLIIILQCFYLIYTQVNTAGPMLIYRVSV